MAEWRWTTIAEQYERDEISWDDIVRLVHEERLREQAEALMWEGLD